jgi:hypothetical protein
MTDDAGAPRDLTARSAAAVGGGLVGLGAALFLGPVLGALVGSASSPLLADGAKALQRVVRRRLDRVELASSVASEVAGCPFDALVEIATDDDRRLEIIGRALQAAALSESELTIRALGFALASGVLASDDAKVDASFRIVSTLGQLDAVDLRVLDRMCQEDTGWDVRPSDPKTSRPSIEEAVPGVDVVLDHVVARLSTLGLISKPDAGGLAWNGIPWLVTSFGRLCVDTLRAGGRTPAE